MRSPFVRVESKDNASSTGSAQAQHVPDTQNTVIYSGPLALTFRRLKLFSLTSMGLATGIAPFMVLLTSNLPLSARSILAATAVGTSAISTGLIGWISKPYVIQMRKYQAQEGRGNEVLEMTTNSLFLKPRVTRIYRPEFLVETDNTFAKWALAERVSVSPEDPSLSGKPGEEEVVADMSDENGQILGRWIVCWGENGEGNCRAEGSILRKFSVHGELLEEKQSEAPVPPGRLSE